MCRRFLSKAILVQTMALSILLTNWIACSYKKPPETAPPVSAQSFDRSFFEKNVGGTSVARTFFCAWAPLTLVGEIAKDGSVGAAKAATHPSCNIQFQIQENLLVGKQINPSLPASNWPTVITIPISQHYNLVKRKDKYQRDTNEIWKETDKDDLLARDKLQLNFSGLRIHDWAYSMLIAGTEIHSVTDFERTEHNGKKFLGFTLNVSSPMFGKYEQAAIRMNFLEFDSEPAASFEPRKYHDDNSNHFGVLWGIGKKLEGIYPVQYVARWDMRPQSLPHEFCLNGFENSPRAKQIAIESIENWNKVFQDAGIVPRNVKAFTTVEKKYSSDFDLRCNTITYIDDKRIANYGSSPLGIAMAQMDVTNGKMLWGGLVVYGGALEEHFENYRGGSNSGNSSAALESPKEAVYSEQLRAPVVGINSFTWLGSNNRDKIQTQLSASSLMNSQYLEKLMQNSKNALGNNIEKYFHRLKEEGVNVNALSGFIETSLSQQNKGISLESYIHSNSIDIQSKTKIAQSAEQEKIFKDIGRMLRGITGKEEGVLIETNVASSIRACNNYFATNNSDVTREYLDPNNITRFLFGEQLARMDAASNEAIFGRNWQQLSAIEKENILRKSSIQSFGKFYRTNIQDLEQTARDFVSALDSENIRDSAVMNRPIQDIIDVSLKYVFLHEFGHVVGLAHNFKENIMPEKGTVPEKYLQELEVEKNRLYHQNSPTVMGYPHPLITVAKKYEDQHVGKQDELALRYIYKNEYAVYNGKDEDFSFRKVPSDGRIPGKDEVLENDYRVSYFPACADYVRILELDPYCNSWDRGYDAKTIAQSYIEDYELNWIKRLTNLIGSNSDSNSLLFYNWYMRSMDVFNKLRKFYDYMRDKYNKEITEIATQHEDNLYSFSECNSDSQTNKFVKNIFESTDREFSDLCEINKMVVEKLGNYITRSGPDFTTYDNKRTSIPSGRLDGDSENFPQSSRLFGTWMELGMLPMKYTALNALTSPIPYFRYRWYNIPNEKYARSGKNTRYSYTSLYPKEFTQAVSDGVSSNIKLYSKHNEQPTIQRTALLMGLFLRNAFGGFYGTNDYFHDINRDYLKSIESQTKFIFDLGNPVVPIFIQAVRTKDVSESYDYVKNFTAMVYEWGSKPIELGEVYMLPKGKVLVRSSPSMFIYPVTELIFLTEDLAIVWGIRVQYNSDQYTNLGPRGLKEVLHREYEEVIKSCLEGAKLSKFFSKQNQKFSGFKISPGIETNSNRYKDFTNSVLGEYKKYWSDSEYGMNDLVFKNTCLNTLDDIGLIIMQSLVMTDIWLPQLAPYIMK